MKKILEKDFRTYAQHDALFFSGTDIIVNEYKSSPLLSLEEGLNKTKAQSAEVFLHNKILLVELEEFDKLCGLVAISSKYFLRQTIDANMFPILTGVQFLTWNKRYNYCNSCGSRIELDIESGEKKCKPCDISFFPNLSPAVMVLIKKENEILLARNFTFNNNMYSVIAGFIDVGENAEQAVHREVKEEVGINIKSLKYFGSQSWPFPNSFMIAFTAEFHDGDIVVDSKEIEDAQWFSRNNMPNIPARPSISRSLIDSFLCVDD